MKGLVAAGALAAVTVAAAAALAAGPKLPPAATYTGKTSQGLVAKIFLSNKGTRVGYTMSVLLTCSDGKKYKSSWSTEGQFAGRWWIRPRADGSFALNSSNKGKWGTGTFRASARFAGRFTTASAAQGTFSGVNNGYNPDGSLALGCKTGPVTWSAKR